jgi:predicted nucleotidyltransferase
MGTQTMKLIFPTLYPDVNAILGLLLKNIKEILQDQFVGMYLYGSLSSGDFNPETSDVDFLVVTTDSLTQEAIAELEAMHHRIWKSGLTWALHPGTNSCCTIRSQTKTGTNSSTASRRIHSRGGRQRTTARQQWAWIEPNVRMLHPPA